MSEESVLLKIKRQFTHDEAVTFLQGELQKVQAELQAANFKKGELISEVTELKHVNQVKQLEIDKLNKQLASPRLKLTKADLKEERFIQMQKANSTLNKQIIYLKRSLNVWRNNFLELNAKVNKKT